MLLTQLKIHVHCERFLSRNARIRSKKSGRSAGVHSSSTLARGACITFKHRYLTSRNEVRNADCGGCGSSNIINIQLITHPHVHCTGLLTFLTPIHARPIHAHPIHAHPIHAHPIHACPTRAPLSFATTLFYNYPIP